MRKVLEDELVVQLQTRVYIAKALRVISQREVAKGFQMSVATLRRYNNPTERLLSRQWAAQTYEKEKTTHTKDCECGVSYANHARCEDCGILTHFDPKPCDVCTRVHGRINREDKGRCDNCVEEKTKYRPMMWGEYPADDPNVA